MKPPHTATSALLTAVLFLGLAVSVTGSAAPASASIEQVRGSAPSAQATPKPSPARIRKGHVIVRLKDTPTADRLRRVYASADTSAGAVRVLRAETLLWRVPKNVSEEEFAARLSASAEVEYAEPDYLRQLAGYTPPAYAAPNEPLYALSPNPTARYRYPYSWWLRDIGAPAMWQQAYTGPDVVGKYPLRADGDAFKVAVLDTGFWLNAPDAHPDGVTNVVAGWDTYSNDGDVTPPALSEVSVSTTGKTANQILREKVFVVSHGTNVAGLIGAQVANGIGSFGVGYDTRVVVYKVAGIGSSGRMEIPDSAVISALDRASTEGCKVINMSFVGEDNSAALRDAVNRAHARGSVLVAAMGNTEILASGYPAALPNVVGVGALEKNSAAATVRASFSTFGPAMDLSAPGAAIWGLTHPSYGDSTYPGYDWWSGTSMATPIVAGGLALLWRATPHLAGDEVVALAQSTATDLYTAGRDDSSGWGELNLLAGYSKLKSLYPLLKPPAISFPAVASSRGVPISWTAVPGYAVRYNVALDGTPVASGLVSPEIALPAMALGQHTVTVTPISARNWADGTEVANKVLSVLTSGPAMLSLKFDGTGLYWTSTESAAPGRTYRLSIDGGPVAALTTERHDVPGLGIGTHTASVSVVDPGGAVSEPQSLVFRIAPPPTVRRITGSDRYTANAALSHSEFTAAGTVVLVSGEVWPDALSASPLAAKLGGPVLLTRKATLTSAAWAEMRRMKTRKVVIVGGSGSVSAAVVSTLRARGLSVRRVWGPDRYSTADAVARDLDRLGGGRIADNTALVASGASHTDALLASAVGARKGWPVLLTRKAGVSAGTRSALRAMGVKSTVVVGTGAAVSATALAQLPGPSRVGATGSSAASVAIANWATSRYPADFNGERFYVASNSSAAYADSLGIGAAAARHGGLLLLTPKTLASPVAAYYRAHASTALTTLVVGGPGTLPTSVIAAIKKLVGAL